MASRLGLGRIIEWAKNADMEEVTFVQFRLGKIISERTARVTQLERYCFEDASHAARKPRRTKAQMAASRAGLPSAADLDVVAGEKGVSA